ncbi:MAG: hypothetical protein MJY83_02205 [Bacteroidales bacterium]|nr:hypothetical protein [Bacteroidales bacterium]
MKKSLLIITIAIMAVLCSSCGKVKDFSINSCEVQSVSLNGLKSLDATLALGVTNPTIRFTIKNLGITVKRDGQDFAYFDAGPVKVAPRRMQTCSVPCTGTIAKGIGLISVANLARTKDFEGFTVDVDVAIKFLWGMGPTLHFKDISVNSLLEAAGLAMDEIDLTELENLV